VRWQRSEAAEVGCTTAWKAPYGPRHGSYRVDQRTKSRGLHPAYRFTGISLGPRSPTSALGGQQGSY